MATSDDVKKIAAALEATYQSLRRTAANISGLLAVGRATCDEIKAYNLWALAVYNTQRGMLTALRAAGEPGVPDLPPLPTLFAWKGVSGAEAWKIDCDREQQGLTGVLRAAMTPTGRPPIYLSTGQIDIVTQGQGLDVSAAPSLARLDQQLTTLGNPYLIWIVVAGLAVTVSLTLGIVALTRYLTEQSIQTETTERTQIQAAAFEKYTAARMACYADCTARGNSAETCAATCARLVDKPNLKIDPARPSSGTGFFAAAGILAVAVGGGFAAWKLLTRHDRTAVA